VNKGGLVETAFYDRTYDEAFAMTVEARDYVADGMAADRDSVAFGVRGVFDCEALRLTTRLSQVMAWLLVQRAVYAGEISIGELRDESHRLGGRDVCFDNDIELLESMPPRFRSLLERSLKLYQRIARLDEMVARDAS
jgi:regulator of CtrA degradation